MSKLQNFENKFTVSDLCCLVVQLGFSPFPLLLCDQGKDPREWHLSSHDDELLLKEELKEGRGTRTDFKLREDVFLGIEDSFLTSDSKYALWNENGGATEIQAGNGALCVVIGSKTSHRQHRSPAVEGNGGQGEEGTQATQS